MTNDKEWHRPKKPYTVTNTQAPKTYTTADSRDSAKSKPKNIVIPAKNNENNRLLHRAKISGETVKISINNRLCSDDTLLSTYEGKIENFDDFTIHLVSPNGDYLINKSAFAVIEFLKDGQ